MKYIKYIIPVLIIFLTIGFAATNVTLSITGDTYIASDLEDFDVYFSSIKFGGEETLSLLRSSTEFVYAINKNEEFTIEYEVTNASKKFDALVDVVCEYDFTEELNVIENNFDSNVSVLSRSSSTGTLYVLVEETIPDSDFRISCKIEASPVERTEYGEGEVSEVPNTVAMLKATSYSDTTAFRSSTYNSKIKTITFEDEINVPETATESWDLGVNQNGNVMAYVIPNTTDSTYYDLYIQSDTQLYANRDMSYWFAALTYVDEINNLELLDTSKTTNMLGMFSETGQNSTVFTLDVSNFDTSSVINMSGMFFKTGNASTVFTLDVSNFDTSSVIDMGYMFTSVGENNPNFTLDVSGFDTTNVTNMYGMFWYTGRNSTIFTLDVSNFDTSNVTNMGSMFAYAGKNSTLFTLDVSNFDTSNVTNMGSMFKDTGYNSTVLQLDVSKFNTSKVTSMVSMFSNTGYTNPNFTLDVSKFDTSNVTRMENMFSNTGYNSTKLNTTITIRKVITNPRYYSNIFNGVATKEGSKITVNYTSETSDLVDLMIATKSSNSNVVKGENVDVVEFTIESSVPTYVETKTYKVLPGMTWAEWIESEYNETGVELAADMIWAPGYVNGVVLSTLNSAGNRVVVVPTDVIDPSKSYYFGGYA